MATDKALGLVDLRRTVSDIVAMAKTSVAGNGLMDAGLAGPRSGRMLHCAACGRQTVLWGESMRTPGNGSQTAAARVG